MLLVGYIGICWLAGVSTLVRWLWHNLYFRRPPGLLRLHRRRRAEISPEKAAIHPEEHSHHYTAHLPGNQILQLDVAERAFDVPRLPPALDGLKILHLSDIHFTGKVGKAYFREVVRIGNELQPDLIALTGDYADDNACIGWIPETLGRLTAKYGVYFVLGNHDTYIDTRRVHETLNTCGPIDLGGQWLRVEIGGESIILAGNELPWIAPAADLSRCGPSSAEGGPVRIVLSHSPDQICWARANGVDLMLCGHTHGGQIRFPLIGAILMPSFYGVKFDNGLFHVPPTILHVTRGVSGKQSLRWNCRPEIALLTLHSPLV
jgi:predicted MPP superfamily phosphohydrolase